MFPLKITFQQDVFFENVSLILSIKIKGRT